ncbi:hypothetical protein FKM82_001434 [Ascaphus truei]
MSSLLSLLLCTTLLFSIACHHTAHCSVSSTTEAETNVTFSGDHSSYGTESVTTLELSQEEGEEDEENEEDFSVAEYNTDDPMRVLPVIKPEKTTRKGAKKNADKKKKKGKKKGNKKNPTPCETTHKDFCIHGECIFPENLQEVTCRCQQHYVGERCSERTMKAITKEELRDLSTTALAVVAVLLSTISIIAIIIIIIVQ